MDVAPLHKVIQISGTTRKTNAFRVFAVLRITILLLLLGYRFSNPIEDAFLLWLFCGCCEIMFFFNFLVYAILRWRPIERITFPERLSQRYERSGELNKLLPVDVFIATADPIKESPITTANTILSVLSVDYPIDKIACYVSDESASPITLAMMLVVSEFAQKWVPFVKKFCIQTPAPAAFFTTSVDTMPNSLVFINEMKVLKEDYEEFNARLNYFAANSDAALKFVRESIAYFPIGSSEEHPPTVEVINNNERHTIVPLLVYVAREKRVGYSHHFKAGAMNALLRVSEAFTDSPVILNVDCDMFVNDSKTVRHAMCFLMDRDSGGDVAFIQFPQIFDNLGKHDLYAGRNLYLYDIIYKGMDGVQSPFYCGTGCFHRREALYGLRRGATEQSSWTLKEPKCNHAHVSEPLDKQLHERHVKLDNSLARESERLCTFDHESQTSWGKEKGWKYGSITEDVITGCRIHCLGWKSIYFYPTIPAFKGLAPAIVSERLMQRKRISMGLGNLLFSKSSPLIYGCSGLTLLQRLVYIYLVVFYSAISVFIVAYALLHVACLFSSKSILPKISEPEIIWFEFAVIFYYALGYLEFKWAGGSVQEWWNDDQHWIITNLSPYAIGTFEALLISMGVMKKGFAVTPKHSNVDSTPYSVSDSLLFIPLVMLVMMFLVGIVYTSIPVVFGGIHVLDVMGGELVVGLWFLVILYPILKQVLELKQVIPRSVMVPSVLATVFYFLAIQCL